MPPTRHGSPVFVKLQRGVIKRLMDSPRDLSSAQILTPIGFSSLLTSLSLPCIPLLILSPSISISQSFFHSFRPPTPFLPLCHPIFILLLHLFILTPPQSPLRVPSPSISLSRLLLLFLYLSVPSCNSLDPLSLPLPSSSPLLHPFRVVPPSPN